MDNLKTKNSTIITLMFALMLSTCLGWKSYAEDDKLAPKPASNTQAVTSQGNSTEGVNSKISRSTNPYSSIVRRNAFGLKEKEVKKAEKKEDKVEEAPEDLGLIINGFSSMGKRRFVYFKIPDKENKGKFKYYTVDVDDDKANPIDVVKVEDKSIDIRYKGRSYSLNYQDHKNKLVRVAKSNSKSKSSKIPSRSQKTKPISRTSSSTKNSYRSNNVINRYGANTSSGSSSRSALSTGRSSSRTSPRGIIGGGSTIRAKRTVNVGGGAPSGMSSEEQALIMEVNRAMNAQQGIPMPPTPGLPSTTSQGRGN